MAEEDHDILAEARHRLDLVLEAEDETRRRAEEDLIFSFAEDPKDQWEPDTLKNRGDRPAYSYNRLGQAIDQVVNDQRQQRPQIKVRPVDDKSDPELADVYNGLIMNIEAQSDADSVYDDGFMYTVAGGFGYWRVINEYADEKSFDQELYVRPVQSQFSVYMDPAAQHVTKRDADWALLSVWVDKDVFREQYGEDQLKNFDEATNDVTEQWVDENQVRIAEYYRRVPSTRDLLELSDGRVVFRDEVSEILDELEEDGITITRERKVQSSQIEWRKISGAGVLEGPIVERCQWIPVIRDCGKRLILGNRERVKGMTRDAKDGQRSYNYMRSDIAEDVLMKPKAPYFVPDTTIEDQAYRKIWQVSHKVLMNYLPFKADHQLPQGGAPIPNTATGMDPGKLTVAQQDILDIQATTGHYDPALGQSGTDEQSGVALDKWQGRSGMATFVYHDNHAKAIAQTGRVLVERIPLYYDTERVIRILGRDGTEEFVRINAQQERTEEDGRVRYVGDITAAKFDVMVDTGPSYATQRQEASDKILALGQAWPEIYNLAADVIAKGIDIPNQDELVGRLRKRLIAQGVVKPNMNDPDEAEIAQAMQGDDGEKALMARLIAAQAQEAEGQAAESAADVEATRARAFEDMQDGIKTMLENMIQARKLQVDPDGIIQMMVDQQSGSSE